MGIENQLLSSDAQRALEEFSMEFTAAFAAGDTDTWATDLGLSRTSSALKTTFPVPVFAALYKEFKGDVKYRSIYQKSLSLTQKTWQDGVAELASVIEAPDFTGWAEQPTAMALEAKRHPNSIIWELLKANGAIQLDGKNVFASDHPVNVFDDSYGTFDNDISGAVSIAGLKAAKAHFRRIKAPNGKPAGLRMTHWCVRPEDEETARDILERDLIIESNGANDFGTVSNRHKGTVKLVVMDEHDDATPYNYALALNKPGMYPWVVQTEGVPEQLVSDKSSALYHTTLQVGIAYILRGNGAIAVPHTMLRLDGTD